MAVSTRPEGFLGDAADWDLAERQLQEGVEKAGFDCRIKPGEAAFYAPKVEADFRDVLGRSWTLATLQIDVALPTRFGLAYIGRDGQSHQPAMLHRAVLGSLERFLAIYIEHTGGAFPFWLAPVQVAVLPIAERHVPQAEKIGEKLLDAGIRSRVDARSETLGFKIREMETKKIPLALVVGDREAADGTVTPRLRGGGNEPAGAQDADGLVAMLVEASAKRRPMPFN
jgi:threonyl-tRNA synthetase